MSPHSRSAWKLCERQILIPKLRGDKRQGDDVSGKEDSDRCLRRQELARQGQLLPRTQHVVEHWQELASRMGNGD